MSHNKHSLQARALIAALSLILTGRDMAQTFNVLHNFAGSPGDGGNPIASVILSGNTLYGTSDIGGSVGQGAIFAVNTDGSGLAILHSFAGGSDGSYPSYGGLIRSGSTLYGTTSGGGATGTLFKVNIDGTGFTNVYTFTNFNPGAEPTGGLVLSGSTLYGTTYRGGSASSGQIFAINTNGTGFTNLFSFTDSTAGFNPYAGLVLAGNTLYGTTHGGGEQSPNGTVFAVNTDGTGYTSLHTFSLDVYDPTAGAYTNLDGANPYAGVILSGSTLYGVSYFGGSFGNGTVYAVNTSGTGFAVLHTFSVLDQNTFTNADGQNPVGSLTISGNTLYGTTINGGPWGSGTAFKVSTDGSGFAILHAFTGVSLGVNSDGTNPYSGLFISGTTLYGTAASAGGAHYGTLFSISLTVSPPMLAITHSATNVVVAWPTNATGFTLQSTPSLGSPLVWSMVSQAPTVVNGQSTVTIPVSGTQSFYRLIQ